MLQASDLNEDHSRCYSGFSGLGISFEEVLARIQQGIDVFRQEVASQRYQTPVTALPPAAYTTYGVGALPGWVLIGGGLFIIYLLTRR